MTTNLSYRTPDVAEVVSGVEMQCDFGSVDLTEINRQVTPEWLSEALAIRCPGIQVLDRRVERITAGNSTKVWLRMEYNEVGQREKIPAVMVMKASFNRQTEIVNFSYDLEMRSYRDMLTRYTINSPRCFYAGKSPDGQTSSVMLEDLIARKVRFCHATDPLSYAEAKAMMEMWAGFHAKSWNDPVLTDGSFPWAVESHKNLEGLRIYMQALLEQQNWDSFAALPRGGVIPKKLLDRDRFAAAFNQLEAEEKNQPQVAMMGDEHLGNLMFDADGTPGVYDFQARIGPWSRSIAYFLNVALDIQDRREWDRALIAHYLSSLVAHGINPPPFEEAFDAYAREALFGFLIWFGNNSSMQTERVNACNTARHAWAMIDNRSFERLGIYN
jgi:hypothetical protein